MKTQIGLGVLSIPVAFDALGVVPGVIVLIAIAAITTWSDYIIGVFKLRHREVYGIDDVGELLFGKTGRVVLGTAFCLCKFSFHLGMPGISFSLSRPSASIPSSTCFAHIRVTYHTLRGLCTNPIYRVDFCGWLGNAGHLDWSQCRLRSRCLHRSLCCRRFYCLRHFG